MSYSPLRTVPCFARILCISLFALLNIHCSDVLVDDGPARLRVDNAPKNGANGKATTSYGGRAYVIDAEVLGVVDTRLADTGALPPEGGAEEVSLLEADIPGLLSAEVLHATTVAQSDASRSEASVANLGLTVGGLTISASLLRAQAAATCDGKSADVSGASEVLNLVVNGQSISVSGAPNQELSFPALGARIIINEQTSSANGRNGDITVNALHVIVDGVADVVISSAHADIHCGSLPACGGDDFVTGGGFTFGTPSGARGNFGVAGGIKNGSFWGHLTFVDHDGPKVKGTGVTAYTVLDETTRRIEGTADVDGTHYSYVVIVSDEGEPGRNDTFDLSVSNGYAASGTLDGGNIQLHKPRACN